MYFENIIFEDHSLVLNKINIKIRQYLLVPSRMNERKTITKVRQLLRIDLRIETC